MKKLLHLTLLFHTAKVRSMQCFDNIVMVHMDFLNHSSVLIHTRTFIPSSTFEKYD